MIGTAGVDFRFASTSGEARGNVLTGTIRLRDGGTATIMDNLAGVATTTFTAMYMDPLKGDLRKKGDLTALIDKALAARVADDYCLRTRTGTHDLGALEHSLGDCTTTTPPNGGTTPPADAGTTDGSLSGSDGSIRDGTASDTATPTDGSVGEETAAPGDAASTNDAAGTDDAAVSTEPPTDGGGCSCRVGGTREGTRESATPTGVGALLALVVVRRALRVL